MNMLIMSNLVFANYGFLFLLLLLIPLVVWYVLKRNRIKASLQVSVSEHLSQLGNSWKVKMRHSAFICRMLALIFLILVLARPQSINNLRSETAEGIDIMMALDLSSSMLARDFKPDRLEASKDVGIEFISGRPTDRIGLTVFSGESFTQCPLTIDHAVLINLMKDLKSGMIEDGTAIGSGLATAITRLKDSEAKSKVIILLTDGVNNRGSIAPVTAAEIAKTFGIRVYTIGVGTIGTAPFPIPTPFGLQFQDMKVEIDEAVLTDIANLTGGKYYRATNKEKLRDIYKEIDKLEKSKIEVNEYSKRKEEYLWFAIAAALFLAFEIILRFTVLRTIP